jgi:hypothetical protein
MDGKGRGRGVMDGRTSGNGRSKRQDRAGALRNGSRSRATSRHGFYSISTSDTLSSPTCRTEVAWTDEEARGFDLYVSPPRIRISIEYTPVDPSAKAAIPSAPSPSSPRVGSTLIDSLLIGHQLFMRRQIVLVCDHIGSKRSEAVRDLYD